MCNIRYRFKIDSVDSFGVLVGIYDWNPSLVQLIHFRIDICLLQLGDGWSSQTYAFACMRNTKRRLYWLYLLHSIKESINLSTFYCIYYPQAPRVRVVEIGKSVNIVCKDEVFSFYVLQLLYSFYLLDPSRFNRIFIIICTFHHGLG